jgi:hypothetical protein
MLDLTSDRFGAFHMKVVDDYGAGIVGREIPGNLRAHTLASAGDERGTSSQVQ